MNPIRALNGPCPQRRLRAFEQAEYVIALRVNQISAMLGDDRSHCVQAIRNLLQSGIVAEALIEGRAAHDISQKDCGQNSFLIHRSRIRPRTQCARAQEKP
jgi:hypothetical protein